MDIAWSRLMYVVAEERKQDVVEPMFVVSLTERRLVDRQWVSSRRKTLAFSVTDPRAPRIDLDAPRSPPRNNAADSAAVNRGQSPITSDAMYRPAVRSKKTSTASW